MVQRLRAQIERVQGRSIDEPVLPVHPALGSLLPGGGLRPGAAYALGPSMSLLFALMARPSREGSWCAAIGMPGWGAEAAEHAGVELSRLVLVPDPGQRWMAVIAAIAEAATVVAIRPPRAADRPRAADVSRLAARLRDRGAVLLVQGPWPQAEAVITLGEQRWRGVSEGDGILEERELTVTVSSPRWGAPRVARMLLPDAQGTLTAAENPANNARHANTRPTATPATPPTLVPLARAV